MAELVHEDADAEEKDAGDHVDDILHGYTPSGQVFPGAVRPPRLRGVSSHHRPGVISVLFKSRLYRRNSPACGGPAHYDERRGPFMLRQFFHHRSGDDTGPHLPEVISSMPGSALPAASIVRATTSTIPVKGIFPPRKAPTASSSQPR